MGFFNDLGKKTSETTSKITKEAKLKMKISENKNKIKDLYEEIGKNIYEDFTKAEKTNAEAIEEKCKSIDELNKEIENANKEILVLNHKKICEKCNAEMEDTALFCPKCGEKQNIEKNDSEEAKEVEVLPKDEE